MASVAETIRKHHVEILRLRAEEAQKFVSARGLTESAFVNILPSYVSSLSETDDKMGRVGSEEKDAVPLRDQLKEVLELIITSMKSALRRSRKAKSVT